MVLLMVHQSTSKRFLRIGSMTSMSAAGKTCIHPRHRVYLHGVWIAMLGM